MPGWLQQIDDSRQRQPRNHRRGEQRPMMAAAVSDAGAGTLCERTKAGSWRHEAVWFERRGANHRDYAMPRPASEPPCAAALASRPAGSHVNPFLRIGWRRATWFCDQIGVVERGMCDVAGCVEQSDLAGDRICARRGADQRLSGAGCSSRPSFDLLEDRAAPRALAAVPFLAFAAPFIIMRNTLRGRRFERRRIEFVMLATVLAGFWSMMSGTVVVIDAAGARPAGLRQPPAF